MSWRHVVPVLVVGSLAASGAHAHEWGGGVGRLLDVSVEIEGGSAPLYASPDGSGRFYFEAREGGRYAIRLANRTGERLGAVLSVDGLNAISGQRDESRGRMYVIGPWEETTVRGWRSSLADVRRFTFVDERASYSARAGKANARMGWIEVAVHRERRPWVYRHPLPYEPWMRDKAEGERGDSADSMGRSGEAPAAKAPAYPAPDTEADERQESGPRARSFPGTGWGPRTDDPAVLVTFDAESAPAERVTLRYEYRATLVALGVLPRPWYGRDRLRERERGDVGFAKPPAF